MSSGSLPPPLDPTLILKAGDLGTESQRDCVKIAGPSGSSSEDGQGVNKGSPCLGSFRFA